MKLERIFAQIGICLSLIIVFPLQAQVVSDGPDVPGMEAFDQVMLDLMQKYNYPDGQLAVTWRGRLVLARAYNNQSTEPVDNQSRFRVASVSKPITATMIHRLEQDGLLSTSDTIDKYLNLQPKQGDTADALLGSITIRNLLEHLSGIGATQQYGYDPMFYDRQIADHLGVSLPVTKSHIQTFMNGVELVSEPGVTYSYSNYGYMLLGLVVESVTGLSYGAYADTIFNSIGIYDLRQGRSEVQRRYANEAGYKADGDRQSVMNDGDTFLPYEYGGFNIENEAGHGNWVFSATELARWLANLDDPEAGDAILNRELLNQMLAPPENFEGENTPGTNFNSAGWTVTDWGPENKTTVFAGSLPSTTAFVARLDFGANFAVLFNRRDETMPGSRISEIASNLTNATLATNSWPTDDLFSELLQATPEDAGARYTGSWYDATHNGEGFVIQAIDPASAVIYWFTYDREGNQRWYVGIGELLGHRMIVKELLQTAGGRFGPDFDPADVITTPVGSLVINFYGDNSAKADYLLDGDSGYMELSRLSIPFSSDSAETAGDWRNGLWYDVTHDGEGFVVEVLPNGQVLVYWFTYDDQGNPAWMIGSLTGSLDDGVDLPMNITTGGNFGVSFDPANVEVNSNGIAKMRIGCEGKSKVEFTGGSAKFPDVNFSLTRLVTYIDPPCK